MAPKNWAKLIRQAIAEIPAQTRQQMDAEFAAAINAEPAQEVTAEVIQECIQREADCCDKRDDEDKQGSDKPDDEDEQGSEELSPAEPDRSMDFLLDIPSDHDSHDTDQRFENMLTRQKITRATLGLGPDEDTPGATGSGDPMPVQDEENAEDGEESLWEGEVRGGKDDEPDDGDDNDKGDDDGDDEAPSEWEEPESIICSVIFILLFDLVHMVFFQSKFDFLFPTLRRLRNMMKYVQSARWK